MLLGDAPPEAAEVIDGEVGGDAHEPLLAALDLQLALPGGLPDTADFAKTNELNRTIAADWVLQGCPLRDLVLTRVVMEPSMVVLRRQLHHGSHRWDVEEERKLLQTKTVQRRDYRLLICARGELDTLFAMTQKHVLNTPVLFAVAPPSCLNEDFSCLAFRMVTRSGAEYERLLAWRHRRPPFRLFLATQSRQVAAEMCVLHEKSPCMLDNFSREFMDENDISSETGAAILQLIMTSTHVDTALIECWHAWSRRVTTRLGTQAQRPAQHDVFGRQVAQRLKRRSAHAEIWRPGGGAETSTTPTAGADASDSRTDSGSRRKRPNSGGGGAWRSHLSKKLKAGITDFSEISASYRSRTEEEIAADAEAGRVATERHRTGLPSFGATRKQEEHARVNDAAVVFNRLHSSDGPVSLADAGTVIAPSLSECNAENYAFLMKVVRKADFLVASEKKKLELELDLVCRQFAEVRGPEIVGGLVRDVPTMARLSEDLLACPPDEHQLRFDMVRLVPDIAEVSTRAIAVDGADGHVRSRDRNLGVGLDAYWNARMESIAPDEWTGPADEPKKEHRCFLAGHCLCTMSGRRLLTFRNKFIATQKLLTMRGTAERELLKEGFLVWVLRGEPVDSIFGGMAVADDASADSIDESTYIVWHMPLVLLSPYVPVFHSLRCRKLDDGEGLVPGEELAVEVCFVTHRRTSRPLSRLYNFVYESQN